MRGMDQNGVGGQGEAAIEFFIFYFYLEAILLCKLDDGVPPFPGRIRGIENLLRRGPGVKQTNLCCS